MHVKCPFLNVNVNVNITSDLKRRIYMCPLYLTFPGKVVYKKYCVYLLHCFPTSCVPKMWNYFIRFDFRSARFHNLLVSSLSRVIEFCHFHGYCPINVCASTPYKWSSFQCRSCSHHFIIMYYYHFKTGLRQFHSAWS